MTAYDDTLPSITGEGSIFGITSSTAYKSWSSRAPTQETSDRPSSSVGSRPSFQAAFFRSTTNRCWQTTTRKRPRYSRSSDSPYMANSRSRHGERPLIGTDESNRKAVFEGRSAIGAFTPTRSRSTSTSLVSSRLTAEVRSCEAAPLRGHGRTGGRAVSKEGLTSAGPSSSHRSFSDYRPDTASRRSPSTLR